MYLQRLCIFGRDGGNGGKDELRRVVALHELHTSAKTTDSKRKRPCQLDDAEPFARAVHRNSFTDLRCWWDSTRKQRYRFSQRSEVRNTLDAWLFNSLHTTRGENFINITKKGSWTLNLFAGSLTFKCRRDLALEPTYHQAFQYLMNKMKIHQMTHLLQLAEPVSLHSCSMHRSGTMGFTSGTTIVSLMVLFGEVSKPCCPLGDDP